MRNCELDPWRIDDIFFRIKNPIFMVTMGQIIDTNYILNITEPFLNHFLTISSTLKNMDFRQSLYQYFTVSKSGFRVEFSWDVS